MICKHCGKENEEGSKFCMWCGQIFEEQYNREMQQQTPYEQQTGAVGNQQQYQQNPYRQQPGGAGSQQQYQQNPYQQQPGGAGYQQQYQQNPYQQQPGGAGYQQQYQQNPYRQQPGGAGYQQQYQQNPYQQPGGAGNPQQYQQNPYQQQSGMNGYQTGTRGPLPMNWYNFVVKVQYILILLFNAVAIEVLLVQGGVFGSKEGQEFMYGASGAFIAADVIYIILIVIASVLCVLVRQKLVKFQKDAWKWYIGYLIFNLAASVLYYIGLAIIYGSLGFEAAVFGSYIIVSLLGTVICVVLNYIYFNKRKHLFVN